MLQFVLKIYDSISNYFKMCGENSAFEFCLCDMHFLCPKLTGFEGLQNCKKEEWISYTLKNDFKLNHIILLHNKYNRIGTYNTGLNPIILKNNSHRIFFFLIYILRLVIIIIIIIGVLVLFLLPIWLQTC